MSGDGTAQRSRIFGHYELQALIGRGGMAEVFRAVELDGPEAGRTVAIKRLLPELARDGHYVQLFSSEGELSRLLRHPNIVEVYEAGIVDDQYFIAMEYIDGRDLGQILKRCRGRKILLPVDFAVYLCITLLEALGYAHSARRPGGQALEIVHCDISPSNLFISRLGEIKLGDFGIARAARDGGDGGDRVWGKAYYLSPESLDGRIDPATDLWAASATLYELLTNERPFTGANPDEVLAAIRRARPAAVRSLRAEVGTALDAAVMRGFAPRREARYADAAAFCEALRPHCDERIGNPMAIAAVVRGLFGA